MGSTAPFSVRSARSSVVGSVKAATPATALEQNPFLTGGGGCGQKK